MATISVAYVNVPVSNLERAVAFFRDVIGLPLRFSDAEFGYAAFDAGGASFAVVQAGEGEAVGRHTGVGFMSENLDADHAELASKGVEFTRPPTKEPWGGYMAVFADPDGNTYYLDERMEHD